MSDLTVMISLAGLFMLGIDIFTGLAVGTIMVVGVAVIGSLTALPAALSLLGSWVDRGKIPFLGRRRTSAKKSRLWEALVGWVVRRPLLTGAVAAIALLALASPALGMRLANPFNDLPTTIPGVGMGSAILIDATVVRSVLLPAAMALLGERCWYLPSWLGWLPDVRGDRGDRDGRGSRGVGGGRGGHRNSVGAVVDLAANRAS